MQSDSHDLKVECLDVTQHLEILRQYRAMSAPGMINCKLEYTGGLAETAFREHLKKLSGG